MLPTFSFGNKCTVAYFILDPGSHLIRYSSGYRIIFQHFHLADMRVLEVDAEILQCTVLRTDQRNGQHSAVENQLRTLSVENDVLHILERKSYQFRVVLIVVGDKVFLLCGSFRIEIITSFGQDDRDRVIRSVGSGDLFQCLCHQWGGIFLVVGNKTEIRQVIRILCLRTGTQEGKTEQSPNSSESFLHIVYYLNY